MILTEDDIQNYGPTIKYQDKQVALSVLRRANRLIREKSELENEYRRVIGEDRSVYKPEMKSGIEADERAEYLRTIQEYGAREDKLKGMCREF